MKARCQVCDKQVIAPRPTGFEDAKEVVVMCSECEIKLGIDNPSPSPVTQGEKE